MLGAGTEIDPGADVDELLAKWAVELGERPGTDSVTTIEDAAERYAETHPQLDPQAVKHELLDRIRIEMTNVVVDVETLASALSTDVSPAGLRRRIGGREPMTLAEYAHLRVTLARLEQ